MSMKLFVGGLSYNTTSEGLQQHFAQYGNVVSAKVIFDKFTNRSKGFGFVEMETEEQGQEAIAKLDNSEFDGRTIKVNEARPMEPRQNNYNNGGNRNY